TSSPARATAGGWSTRCAVCAPLSDRPHPTGPGRSVEDRVRLDLDEDVRLEEVVDADGRQWRERVRQAELLADALDAGEEVGHLRRVPAGDEESQADDVGERRPGAGEPACCVAQGDGHLAREVVGGEAV